MIENYLVLTLTYVPILAVPFVAGYLILSKITREESPAAWAIGIVTVAVGVMLGLYAVVAILSGLIGR